LTHAVRRNDLVRVGSEFDGGYVVPATILAGCDGILGLGIHADWSFEEQALARMAARRADLYDPTTTLPWLWRRAPWGVVRIVGGLLSGKAQRVADGRARLSAPWRYSRFFEGAVRHVKAFIGPCDRGGDGGAGVIVEGDTVFVATGLSEVLALSAADGSVKWRVRVQAPMRGAPSFANGRIFITTLDSSLVALSAEDGKVLWRYRAQAILTVPLGLPPPAISGETVVAGFPSGEILAFRANDGRVLWSDSLAAAGGTSLADVGSVRAAPVITRNDVIAIGMGGIGLSIDLRAGRRIWEREFGGTEMPWVAGDWVFGVTAAGEMAALQRETGLARWAVSLRPPAQGNRAQPQVQLSSPLLAGGRLFVGTSLAELVALDPSNGDVLTRQRLPGALSLPMMVVGGRLILATDDGSLIAFAGEG
jgi:outer membrane protein assembly factor BamB